ncbi:DUF5336 domain-containing protein [Nocardioides sp. J2M5]|uniref:DUF5336 domain-containing protein n=1 Tax=Nocardioides palaemonis TaxID=2829810 RepID=UPI001BA4453C|nr:DUF5336 domain-containing protein [Nocardioides palaemonis]MBS2940247.1 DUF5336 domain-containing protein [Nocardioides palaemonis]
MSDTTPGAEPTPEQPRSEQPADPATPQAGGPSPASGPASGWSSAEASRQANEAVATLKKGNPLDLATIGAGLVVFLGSFLPYYTVSVDAFGASSSASATAWHGFFGWFGALLALAGAVVLVLHLLSRPLPVPVRLTVLGLFAVAALCTLLALFVLPGGSCDDTLFGGSVCDLIDQGHGIGYWLALLGSLAGTALAALRRTAP